MQSRLIILIGMVFSNGTMLSVSDKYDSVNECTKEISELMKLHIQGVWQNAHKFIRQLAHYQRHVKKTASHVYTGVYVAHTQCVEHTQLQCVAVKQCTVSIQSSHYKMTQLVSVLHSAS